MKGYIDFQMVKDANFNEKRKWNEMMAMVYEFKYEKQELRRIKVDKHSEEQSILNRLLKNDVIMSDRLERIEKVLARGGGAGFVGSKNIDNKD